MYNLLTEATATEVWEKYYKDIPHEEFIEIIQADPTTDIEKDRMGKYSKWLLNLYKRKTMQIEDIYKAERYLEVFDKYSGRLEVKDINRYKSLPDLYVAIKDFIDSDAPASKKEEIRRIKKDADKVYEDDTWLVVVPHTEEAACYYGKNTQWCTAAERSRNAFNSYKASGTLYININKITNEKFQFHFENGEFKDENDEDVLFDDIGMEEGTGIYKFYVEKGYTIPEATIEHAIRTGDYDMLQHLLWYDDKVKATESDFDYAIELNDYSMADTIFWNIDVNDLSHWGVNTYLDLYDNLTDGRFYPENETNKEYVDNIKETVEHVMQVDSVDDNVVLRFVFKRLVDPKNIKNVLEKSFGELVDRLLKSDMTPDDIEDIAIEYELDEEFVSELIRDFKSNEEFKKISKKPIENDRIRMIVKQVNFNEEKNSFYYYVKILFKKDNKQYEGWMEKNKALRLLTQYDLFHGE